MTRHAALFDLDGVLVNTEPVYTRIWSDIDRRFPTGVENFAYKIKGTTLPAILSTYYPDSSIREKVRDALESAEMQMDYPLFDGVTEFLRQLKDKAVPAAIVTSSNDLKMSRLFDMYPGLRNLFDAVITDSWVREGKPSPECYLVAARELGVPAEDCFVFEDSYNGLKAGRASGAHVIAVASSNPREALEPLSDIVIDSLSGFTADDMLALALS